MDELIKMIEQLLQLEDSVFDASRELIEKRILETLSGAEGTPPQKLFVKKDIAGWKRLRLQKL